jgi:hypothetical protein
MNNLEIEIKMVKVIRKAISILLIINAVSWFIGHYTSFSAFDIVYSVFTLGAGIIFLSGKIETEKISLRTNDISVFIKWVGMIRGREVIFTEIAKICLSKAAVVIERNGMKRLKYNLDSMDPELKKEVYVFFIKVAAEKNLKLERHFER